MNEIPYVAYHTLKVYPDNTEKYTVKVGKDLSLIEKSTREKSAYTTFANSRRSARRVYSEVKDICDCNKFEWFITLTFTSDEDIVYNRKDDNLVRSLYQKWRKDVKEMFPDMIYIAVPEYHQKGGLHFHLLVGNIDELDLKLQFAKTSICMGQVIDIYNVNCWKFGYSTASKIVCPERCNYYVMKYITKGDTDTRFFGKKRYYCSHNLVRPQMIKYKYEANYQTSTIEGIEEFSEKQLVYANLDKQYYKFE